MRLLSYSWAVVALLAGALLTGGDRVAQALPPAGNDVLPVLATVEASSRLGSDTIELTGTAQINRGAPYMDGGVEVANLEIVNLDLAGFSAIGAINVDERPNSGSLYVSAGEIRNKQAGQDFPASSFLDLFADVTVPANPTLTLTVHNEAPLRLRPRAGGQVVNLSAWPPLGVTYQLDPIFGFDNDGDTLVDEDSADDDGDGLVNEDPPGGGNQDTDSLIDEDPAPAQCTLAICDDDGDTQIDEDPGCIPLLTSAGSHLKAGYCIRNASLQIPPELPSFSLARGGPTARHPADILGLLPGSGGVSPPTSLTPVLNGCNDDTTGLGVRSQVSFTATAGQTYQIQVGAYDTSPGGALTLHAFSVAGAIPSATAVSGNDNFAGAATVPSLPFRGTQTTTASATTEPVEPRTDPAAPAACGAPILFMGHTVWYRYTPAQTATVTLRTTLNNDGDAAFDEDPPGDSNGDTIANDDGDAATDEDGPDSTFDTVLAVYTGSGFSTGGTGAPYVRIPCTQLGLTTTGCNSIVSGDDLDALSYGDDDPAQAAPAIFFSVAPAAQGTVGSAVRTQHDCPAAEPEGDEFGSTFDFTNTLVMDGNGPIGTCASAFPLFLIEGATRDDLDALDRQDPTAVDPDLNGVPDSPIYFSLDPTSPSLGTLGLHAADILKTVGGNAPSVFASRASLGLAAGDDVDALCLRESGDGAFGLGDALHFSLAAGSPTLAAIAASPGDILAPGSPSPTIAYRGASLGLQAADDLDAMKCQFKPTAGDTDGDTIPNSSDPDDDNDGCTDVKELGLMPNQGGQRNSHNFWDFLDVPGGSALQRDRAVGVTDIATLVQRFGSNDVTAGQFYRTSSPLSTPNTAVLPPSARQNYHPAYDRGGALAGGKPWSLRPADGSVTVIDIANIVAQFGHTCV